ncbi:DNA polymerase III subunit chi [Paenalcaligenes hominis]|uniref:DNA polymerase III subunit chi n=1 Tax=Paenalcaligenes hominis TaxID=643674 RepID=UPI003523A18E
MTTRVDFAFGAPHRLRTACQVVRKHYIAGRKLIIYHSDKRALARFDRLLWGFEPTAFIPHVGIQHPLAAQTPILLTHSAPEPHSSTEPSWLLNLDTQCPPTAAQFQRILEIVSEQEQDKHAARQRWRQYQQWQFDVRAHQLSPS